MYVLLSNRLHGDIFYLGEQTSHQDLRRFFQDAADYIEKATGEGGLVMEVLTRLSPGGTVTS